MNRMMASFLVTVICLSGCSNERARDKAKTNTQTPALSHEREFLRTVELLQEASRNKYSTNRVRQIDGDIRKEFAPRIVPMLLKQPDYRSFLLWYVYDCVVPNADLAPKLVASILASALNEVRQLMDFGYFSDETTENRRMAKKLVDCGPVAVTFLKPVLDNKSRVSILSRSGISYDSQFRYRRCDYAYMYISQILGRKTAFDVSPVKRDIEITKLKDYLKTWKPKNSDLPNENH